MHWLHAAAAAAAVHAWLMVIILAAFATLLLETKNEIN